MSHFNYFVNGLQKNFPFSSTNSSAVSDIKSATGCQTFLKMKYNFPSTSFVGHVYFRPLDKTWHHCIREVLFTPKTIIFTPPCKLSAFMSLIYQIFVLLSRPPVHEPKCDFARVQQIFGECRYCHTKTHIR